MLNPGLSAKVLDPDRRQREMTECKNKKECGNVRNV